VAIPLTLKVFKGDALVTAKDYERDIIKIGRLASAHLCLDDDKVSRIHSVIDATDGKLSITDMGSMEGTYVNGKRVNKSPLSWGDEIKVGNTRIVVEQRAAMAAGAPSGRPPESTEPLKVYTAAAANVQVATSAVNPVQAGMTGANPIPAPAQVAPQPVQVQPPMQAQPQVQPNVVVNNVRMAPPPPPVDAPVNVQQAVAQPQMPPQPQVVMNPVSAEIPSARPASQAAVPRASRKESVNVKPTRPRTEASGDIGLQVRFVWGDQILAVHQFEKPHSMLIGTTNTCAFHLSGDRLGSNEFELLKGGTHDFVVRVPSKSVGEIDDGTGPVELKASKRLSNEGDASTLTLSTRDFAWFDVGGVRAEFAFAPMPKKVIVPLAERLDFKFLNTLLLIFFLFGAFVISAKNLNTDDDSLADDLLQHQAVVAKFLLQEEKPKKNPFLEKLNSEKKSDAEAAAKAKNDEGKMGLKQMKQDNKTRSANKAIDPHDKDRAKAMVANLFGGSKGGIQTIFGNGGLGGDLKNAVGNMFGNQVGDSGGLGGLGIKGSGGGGGGMGNTVGIGAIGTHGRGGGMGAYGNGAGNLGGKKDVDIGIQSDNAVVQGSLDKELIRQVIHRNRAQIRYCYEQQLVRFPKLEAKVAITFVIGPEGTVQLAKVGSSNSNNSELDQCLVTHFKSWQFPKPKGGGIVQVTYPVILTQAGQ
jgi:pSer/pThr/pTyr-binding forkhead associated (FHA) protein